MKTNKNIALAVATVLTASLIIGCGVNKSDIESTLSDPKSVVSDAHASDETNENDDIDQSEKNEAGDEKSDVQPVSIILGSHSENVWEAPGAITNEKKMAEYRFFDLMLSEEDAKEYPELSKTLDDYSKDAEKTAKDEIELLVEAYNDYYEYAEEWERQEYALYMEETCEAFVMRADSNVVSVCASYYEYWGGVHGMYGLYGQNYDTKTGRIIKFSEVITDEDSFFEIVDEKLKTHPEYKDYYEQYISMDEYREILEGDDPLFIIDNEGVIIVFNPYAIGAYSMGQQIIKVLFSEAPEIFNEKYTIHCDSYVIPLLPELETANAIDIEGDGNRLPVVTQYDYDSEYSEFTSFSVSVGNRSINLDYAGYDISTYVAKTGDKYYFLAFVDVAGDWTNIVTVDLSTMKETGKNIWTAGMVDAGSTDDFDSSYPSQYRDSERVRNYAFTSPDRIMLSPDFEILGNARTGRGIYSLDVSTGDLVLHDGVIEIDGEYYALKTKMKISCDFVTYDGNVKNKGSIPAGTYLCMIRTDGEKWADFQAVDEDKIERSEEWPIYQLKENENYLYNPQKDIMRIHLESTDQYYKMVDGIHEDDVFEGLMYGG